MLPIADSPEEIADLAAPTPALTIEDPKLLIVGRRPPELWPGALLLMNTCAKSSTVSMKSGLNVMFTVAWWGKPVIASMFDMNVCCT